MLQMDAAVISQTTDAIDAFVDAVFEGREALDIRAFRRAARFHPILVSWLFCVGTVF